MNRLPAVEKVTGPTEGSYAVQLTSRRTPVHLAFGMRRLLG